jgi:predicted O-methyltransferase YrrM
VLLKRKFEPNLDTQADRDKATQWCAKLAVPTPEALQKIGYKGEIKPFAEVVGSAEWAGAHARAEASPVKMGGAGNLELLYYAAEHCQAKRVLETGVAYGWSSFSILQSLAKRDGKLASTDMPYAQLNNDEWVGTVVPDALRKHWTLVRQADKQGLPKALEALGGQLDMCHYDSDKSYQGRMWAYPILWNKLRKGGLFISDDIQDNEGFRHWVEKLGKPFIIVEFDGKYIGVVEKQ